MTFWGRPTLVSNDAKIVHFTFYIYFPGALGPRCFLRAMTGPPLDTTLCDRVRKLNERAGAGREKIRWSGAGAGRLRSGSGKRRER